MKGRTLDDLNDYLYFSQVVTHGGFSAASRALMVPKSKLSRRVADLERRFGVKLIDRSPHSFRVTPVGQEFYDRCRAMLLEAERAKSAVCMAKSEPEGILRLSCPPVLLDACVSTVVAEFLRSHPKVELHVLAVDRPVDLVEERVHVAIRPLSRLTDDDGGGGDITTTRLRPSRDILVAAPSLLEHVDLADIRSIARVPTISLREPVSEWVEDDQWDLVSEDGRAVAISHRPRLLCRSVPAAMNAVLSGVGVGLLPETSCASALEAGDLVRVLPEWGRIADNIALVTTTRRGISPTVSALVQFLIARLGDTGGSSSSRVSPEGPVLISAPGSDCELQVLPA